MWLTRLSKEPLHSPQHLRLDLPPVKAEVAPAQTAQRVLECGAVQKATGQQQH